MLSAFPTVCQSRVTVQRIGMGAGVTVKQLAGGEEEVNICSVDGSR